MDHSNQAGQRDVERVYAKVLTRIIRDPTSKGNVNRLPLWIVTPDYPVPKRQKQSLEDVALNDGLHLHALAAIPPVSRLKVGLDQHFQEFQDLYVEAKYPLRWLHAEPIISNPGYAVGYGFKSVQRGRATFDDIIVLPRSLSELDGGRGGETSAACCRPSRNH